MRMQSCMHITHIEVSDASTQLSRRSPQPLRAEELQGDRGRQLRQRHSPAARHNKGTGGDTSKIQHHQRSGREAAKLEAETPLGLVIIG